MKIAVCIKQVVTREWPLRVNEAGTWIRDSDASFELNEPDAYALEEALRLKEKQGGEVVVCCAGPARATQVIREALARGADRAIHVEPDGARRAPTRRRSRRCSAAAMRDEQFDLVLTGLQSDDQGFGQVGVMLAERARHAARHDHHGSPGRRRRAARQARARRRLVPVGRAAAAGAADHPERHQPAPLRDAQGHHGGEEEGDPQGRRRRPAGAPLQRILRVYAAGEGEEDADDRRRRGRGRAGRWSRSCATTRG